MDQTIRFTKRVLIRPCEDFDQNTIDSANRLVWNAYNSQKDTIEIQDFLHLFTIDKLTDKATVNFIENDLNIRFISMNLDYRFESDAKPLKLTKENTKSYPFRGYWFIAFSDNYKLIDEDDTMLRLHKDGKNFEFNKQELDEITIAVQHLDILGS